MSETIKSRRPVVTFVTLVLSHYRVPLHERIRELMADAGIDYRLIYSDPTGAALSRLDTADLGWARKVPVRRMAVAGREAFWQDARRLTAGSDLTIVSQENKLLLNLWLLVRRAAGGGRVAFFGHGRNRQTRAPNGASERLKRWLASRVDWWFAYTAGVASLVEGYGFSRERITVTCNAIDMSELKRQLASLTAEDVASVKQRHGIRSDNIGVFIGSLYRDKRIDLLVDAAREVRRTVPDFELVIVGSGPDAALAEKAARESEFIHVAGTAFEREKAALLKLAKVCLMPGAVGLGVLDAFAAGTPIVTTDVGNHGPEIDYVEDGVNGLIVPSRDPTALARSVASLMADEGLRERLAWAAADAAGRYTIEQMAQNFADGIVAAVADRGSVTLEIRNPAGSAA